ncbi:VCBS repeat-containing protein [Catalinimonas sp. 4WD22]|uniref:VCBS repeat-containing protein n=1 Tax=Catalinimonas locisalis TaxID=3133978 RepID=UPI003101666B
MQRLSDLFLLLFLLTIAYGCSEEETSSVNNTQEIFRLLPAEQTGVDFTNTIEENDTFNMVDFFYVYNGGGVAIGDVNNDSLPDIFFTGNMVSDRLYLNKGKGENKQMSFEDISETANILSSGWSTGVTMVDINSDGLLDIYVCRSGNYEAEKRKNKLYVNNGINDETGHPTFTESAEAYGLADTSYSTQAVFFDYDLDGDLDVYLLNHTNAIRNPNQVTPLISDGSGPANDKLYRNNGAAAGQDPTFTDVTQEAGILYDGLGLGVGISDINNDGWPDIFVTNDFIANDYLYINNQKGPDGKVTFSEMSKSYFGHVSHFSMGHDIADFNNDGLSDILTLDMLPRDNYHRKKMSGPMNYNLYQFTLEQGYMPQYMRNTVQLNLGKVDGQHTKFAEIGQLLDLHATDWSWAPLMADFNNDGKKDIFISNGYLRDITDLDFINYTAGLSGNVTADSLDHILKEKAKQMPSIKLSNFIFENQGELSFADATDTWGINNPSLSNGAAYGDLDRDGDLDLVVNNINEPAFIYENLTTSQRGRNFLGVQLKGDRLNPTGIGAKVALYATDMYQLAEQSVVRGYQSSVAPGLHFGLDTIKVVDSIIVNWPDGKISKIEEVVANQYITVVHAEAKSLIAPPFTENNTPWFSDITQALGLNHQHVDPEYNDFGRQYLLPHKLSDQGPGIAVGDMNADGLEDFFIGGAYDHSGYLFFQQQNGKFTKKALTRSDDEMAAEDLGVLLFDYDNDNDLDLYIASGSNEHYADSQYYQDRLYENDGKGNFTLTEGVLPAFPVSSSCVRAADYDQDGDLDLFVGGRLIPLKYPLPPDSYLLINEGGKFVDKTNALAPALRKLGMVTDALWTDFDNDMDADLIVVGEFMPLQFFENIEGKLENVSNRTGLNYTAGLWNSINGGDFDSDGDTDYVLGNLGLNTREEVSRNEPMTIYATDLDQNGFIDPIITNYINHQEYPTHSRDDIIRQVPALKKKFPDYESYANASISDILTPTDKSRAYTAKSFHHASSYLENIGEGRFKLIELPKQAQIAPIYGILIEDFDGDGNLDVLLSGNDFGTEVVSGRYDASTGIFLKGNGQGNFTPMLPLNTGLLVDKNAKGAASIQVKGQPVYLFANTNGPLQAYNYDAFQQQDAAALNVPNHIFKAKITLNDSSQRVQEFYYGNSYLSQSGRKLTLYGNEVKIKLYDFSGKEETHHQAVF